MNAIRLITQIFSKKEKINRLTADIIRMQAELNYLERQKGLEMQNKIMGGARYDTAREI